VDAFRQIDQGPSGTASLEDDWMLRGRRMLDALVVVGHNRTCRYAQCPFDLGTGMVVAVIVYHAMDIDFGATEFLLTMAAAIFIAIALQIWRVERSIPESVKRAKPEYDIPAWIPRSFKMWISALLDTTSQYLEVVIIDFDILEVVNHR